MGKWKQELEEILKEETDMGRDMIPKYARCYARIILENFISQEIEKAREEGRRETLLEMEREFSEYEVPDDVRYTHPLFYINNIIEEKLSKLTTK